MEIPQIKRNSQPVFVLKVNDLLSPAISKMINELNTEDVDYVDVTDEPQHIAFLGNELDNK